MSQKVDLSSITNQLRRDFSSGLGDVTGLIKDLYDTHIGNIVGMLQEKLKKLELENTQLRNLLKENKIEITALPDAVKAQ